MKSAQQKTHRLYFATDLPRPASNEWPVHFTLKYRTAKGENWKWAQESFSLADGQLCFQSREVDSDLKHYLKQFSSDLTIQSEQSQAPGASLWSLTAPLKPASGAESAWTETNLGTPRSYTRWFCLVRPWTPWLAPRHGKAPFNCGNGSVLCAFQRWDGSSLVLVAVSGVCDVLTELKPDGNGNVIAVSRNDRDEIGTVNIIAAVAPDFETANAACIYHARTLVQGYQNVNQRSIDQIQLTGNNEVQTQSLVDWDDGLTYCTWNSLGQDLNEEKIFNALDDLKKNKIHSESIERVMQL